MPFAIHSITMEFQLKSMCTKISSIQLPDNLPIPEFALNPSDIMLKFTAPEDRGVHGTGG